MRVPRSPMLKTAVAFVLALLVGLPGAHALVVRQDPSRFDRIAIPDPSVVVSAMTLSSETAKVPVSVRAGWNSFRAAKGAAWEVYIDARSGAPLFVQGAGIPLVPGSGNALQSAEPVTLDSLAGSLRGFVTENASLLMADDGELILSSEGSSQITPELWKVIFERSVAGVPVTGDRYIFYVGHGNLIAFGATRWSRITTDAVPSVSSSEGLAVLAAYMDLKDTETVDVHDRGTLMFVPMAAAGTAIDSFDGAVGTGYETALAWRFALEVEGEPGAWVGLVDAHTGAVLALYDTIQYAQAKGGALPLTDDGICPDGCEQANFPMPFADIKIGAINSTAGSMGAFSCTPGGSTATTTLAAQYVKVVDSCGAISQSVTCDADLDLKTSGGTDCIVPTGASAGDTHAARSSFYHLNRIKEHVRAWLPSNSWLTLQLTDNVNINLTCNAFWSSGGVSGTVNFYRSGGGCRNTGEIASIFLHEWGHGLDQNDGGGYDNPTEAYADVASFFLTHKSCIGRGFRSTNCGGYGNACLACTGVRDQDWDQRVSHAPSTPEGFIAGCSGGSGPCGREGHCEAYLAGETMWDLAVRDLPAAGLDQQTAWQTTDRLWFKSRTGSGGSVYTCGSPASNRSCAAGSWFTQLRTIDDDDGNLANGTPYAAAIFAAFNRHNIPCGASTDASNQNTSTCPSLAAPTLTPTSSGSAIALSWTAVVGASSYNVLRNDQGCGWGFTVIANVAGTAYTDTNLPDAFPLYYAIQAVGSNSACTGTLSTCTLAQAGGPHGGYDSNARVADTCATGGAGDNDGILDSGEQIQFSIAIKNDGFVTLTGVTATLTPTTPGVTMGNATASFGTIAVGATGTSLAPHFTAQLPAGLACGSSVNYSITINSNEGSWTESFPQTVGQVFPPSGTALSESFSSGIPGTWTIVDGGSGGGASATWTTANPCNRSAASPLANPLAIVDSNCAGLGNYQDEQLITPVLNLSGMTTVTLDYDEYFNRLTLRLDEKGDVDVKSSLTGGAWVNVVRNQGASTSNPNHRTVNITTQAAGASDVQLRFHYYDAGFELYWQVDNVVVSWTRPAACDMHACDLQADLTVAVTDGPDPVSTGQDVTYAVAVTNNGPSPASNVQLDEATPSNTTFGSIAAAAGWICTTPAVGGTGAIACTAPSLAASSVANFTIAVRVNWCAGNGMVITDTASVVSAATDLNVGNNSTSTMTSVNDSGACNDANGCTQTDTCQAGTCVGGNPVACAAQDQCHVAGTCSPGTGLCSNPAASDGAGCDDADGCTANDACSSGMCFGAPIGPPSEIASQQFASPTLQQWDPAVGGGPSPVYDVVRGVVGEWPVGIGASEQCKATGITAAEVDDTDTPAEGGAFWYLVRVRDACGIGDYGTASDGSPRVPAAPCP